MKYFTHCPIPGKGGRDCWNEPHPANTFGICMEHWREVTSQWHEEEPAVTVYCTSCSNTSLIDYVEMKTAICAHCHEQIHNPELFKQLQERQQQSLARYDNRAETCGVVYYMRFGDRIKIGFTTDLTVRATQIPNDEVVAAEPGTYATERQRHTEFTPERITERGEWFNLTPRLAFHMANVRDAHGEPFELSLKRRQRATSR